MNGRLDLWVETARELVADPIARPAAGAALLWNLPALDRHREAQEMADEVLQRTRSSGNPMWIAWAMAGIGRAFAPDDPERALAASRSAAAYAREMNLPFYEALNAREAAPVEAAYGDVEQGLAMYDDALDVLHRSGAGAHLSIILANLATFFARFDRPEVAATLIGVSLRQAGSVSMAMDVDATADRLRTTMGPDRYAEYVDTGAAMDRGDAVRFARDGIAALRATVRNVESSLDEGRS
jgi:hypothetical protein